MANPVDVSSLVTDLMNAATGALRTDVSQLRGFSTQQLSAIAQQSAIVAAGVIDGSIGDDTRDYFLDSIEEMVRSFANTLAGLVTVTIERVWNAMVQVIWGAINTATGLALKIPGV